MFFFVSLSLSIQAIRTQHQESNGEQGVCFQEHKCQFFDSIDLICKQYSISRSELYEYNPELKDMVRGSLFGLTLKIPYKCGGNEDDFITADYPGIKNKNLKKSGSLPLTLCYMANLRIRHLATCENLTNTAIKLNYLNEDCTPRVKFSNKNLLALFGLKKQKKNYDGTCFNQYLWRSTQHVLSEMTIWPWEKIYMDKSPESFDPMNHDSVLAFEENTACVLKV